MNDPEYDVHPLDRDYSLPIPEREARELSSEERLRRFGVIVFGTGFALVVLSAITLSAFQGGGWVESFGSAMHRFAMIAILVGGIMIIVSYRLPTLRKGTRLTKAKGRQASMGNLARLLVWNAAFFVLMVALSGATSLTRSMLWIYFVYNGILTIACALMVTMIVWHRGVLRAYAIGAVVALLMNGLGFMFALNTGNLLQSEGMMMLGRLATIQLSGLICAGYVDLVAPGPELNESD